MNGSCREKLHLLVIRCLPSPPGKLELLHSGDTEVSEVTGGNLNDIIRIVSRTDPSTSVILKHAGLYTKIFGPEYPLSPARNTFEYRALRKFHQICPGSVPEPYFCNEHERIFLMEDLFDYKDMQTEMISGKVERDVFREIAGFLLRVHRSTHRKTMSNESFTELVNDFRNDGMLGLGEQYFFIKPFLEEDPSNRHSEAVDHLLPAIYEDRRVLDRAEGLRQKYLRQKDCLLHGDLHMCAVMVNGSSAKIIDPEFVTVGPAAFDLGVLIANYLFSYYAHSYYPLQDSQEFHKTLMDAITETVETYIGGMASILNEDEIGGLIEDTTGYIGCEIIRRICGVGYVTELEGRPLAEIACLKFGLDLVTSGKERPRALRGLVSYLERIDEPNVH